MNKWLKGFLIFIGILLGLWFTARVTGALESYTIPTPGNEPAIHAGKRIFTTNLKTPHKGDFVIYESPAIDEFEKTNQLSDGKHSRWLHRLCAMENDVIEMKRGIFFVNGKDFDSGINLYHVYVVPVQLTHELPEDENTVAPMNPFSSKNDSLTFVNLTDVQAKEYSLKYSIKKYIDTSISTDKFAAFAWFGKQANWVADNFGPIKVPPGYCFVMGDNRNNALDSRYLGFVKLSDIKGVKL